MTYTMMFYNLENLYDTVDDPDTLDDDFTPQGAKRWDDIRYGKKLDNLSQVFSAVDKAYGGFPVIVGMSEVENMKVLRDLASRKRMSGAHYKCVHYESNDLRGVDVGLFYRPDKFEMLGSEPVKLQLRSGREYIGRDILCVWGRIGGEMFAVYVCHLLSRRAGVGASAGFRRAGAETVRNHAEEMGKRYPGIKVVVMGDMNDSPADESLSLLLRARKNINAVAEGDYFNPFWKLMEEGRGTSVHSHRWVLYDNIIVSRNLLQVIPENVGIRLARVDKTHWAEIFSRNFMLEKGRPRRSYNGDSWQNGYSDHLPVIIKLNDK